MSMLTRLLQVLAPRAEHEVQATIRIDFARFIRSHSGRFSSLAEAWNNCRPTAAGVSVFRAMPVVPW